MGTVGSAEQGERARRRLVVNFHGIGEPPAGVPVDERRYWCPERDWPAIADVLAEAARDGVGVEVTFDDGNASDVEVALPALLERRLTAIFHVCAGRLGQRGYLDRDSLLQLRDAGMGIGSHGWNHVDLRTASDAELAQETEDSRQSIADACGTPVTDFAVPLGRYDRRVLRHLRGYQTVYTSDTTTATWGSWIVPRWSYVQGWTTESVSDLVRAEEPTRHRLRQRAAMMAKRWR